jgi:hypothetical protein
MACINMDVISEVAVNQFQPEFVVAPLPSFLDILGIS